jgi:hypothetical protein
LPISVSHIEIKVAKGEDERRAEKSLASSIAHEIYEYADERVGHAEGVPKDELMLACYHRLGELLALWGKKLDKLEKISKEPEWLKKYVKNKEAREGRPMVYYDSVSLGFAVDNLYFAKEKGANTLSDDLLLVSEPTSMLMEDFKDLVSFCKENGLDFYVDGFNTKLPGRAFRVCVYAPKLGARSHLEFREKSLAALELFKKLSDDKRVVERKAFVDELVKTGEYDELLATKVVDVLLASGQIPKSLLS